MLLSPKQSILIVASRFFYLDIFRMDPNYEDTEEKYKVLKKG